MLVRDLVRLLSELTGLYGELAMHMRNKLEAMKRADSDQIQSITAREMVLANRTGEREGLRRQITRRILESLGRPAAPDRGLKLTELAEQFVEPLRSQLLVAAAGLRDRLEDIDRLRIKTALISQEMLKHLGEVLAVMRSAGSRAEVYARNGRREAAARANVFEAVG